MEEWVLLKRFSTIHPSVNGLLYGGDYNPDQWQAYPEVLQKDVELMKLANVNAVSVNIFGWAAIEAEEGTYTFGWLDDVMDNMASIGGHILLSTPSGARPAWLSKKYPEVLRVNEKRQKQLHGQRHNHCFTSPIYREKTAALNKMLAERYKDHPALIMWHVSNEYSGECHCDLCQEAFREWLKNKYDHQLEKLNHAWWATFWSHTFTDWDQIESPSSIGENQIHGLTLDWKRFVTDQTVDFYRNEIKPLKEITPNIAVSTNFMGENPHMGPFKGLDYSRFANYVDVITWDAYPAWHNEWEKTWQLAANTAFVHDLYRSLKGGQPFLLLESTPSLVNWQITNKLKRPGMNLLSSLQAVAHGSDSVMYFQWRKSRGSSEKLHGAVVDHYGNENTRVFKEAAELGSRLASLKEVAGASVDAKVAIIYDWENRWALYEAQGFAKKHLDYVKTCEEHYQAFWKKGIPVDVIPAHYDLSSYEIVIAPMLYMLKRETAQAILTFVESGGTYVSTYMSGIVDANDLCYIESDPNPLFPMLGLRVNEIDSLYKADQQSVNWEGLSYQVSDFCEIVEPTSATVLAQYEQDFYKNSPALTVNTYKKGQAYHISARTETGFLDTFYEKLANDHQLSNPIGIELPEGVSLQSRTDGETTYLFLMNFTEETQVVNIPETYELNEIVGEGTISNEVTLSTYDVHTLKLIKGSVEVI
ncbi:beta-galactosidase [Bacillus gibsonii]|nr:beta-galactosidase [Alkalicoccobacillus gibsonii]